MNDEEETFGMKVKHQWRKFLDYPTFEAACALKLLSYVLLAMLIPFGPEMIAGFCALVIMLISEVVMEEHHKAEIVAVRMERKQ